MFIEQAEKAFLKGQEGSWVTTFEIGSRAGCRSGKEVRRRNGRIELVEWIPRHSTLGIPQGEQCVVLSSRPDDGTDLFDYAAEQAAANQEKERAELIRELRQRVPRWELKAPENGTTILLEARRRKIPVYMTASGKWFTTKLSFLPLPLFNLRDVRDWAQII